MVLQCKWGVPKCTCPEVPNLNIKKFQDTWKVRHVDIWSCAQFVQRQGVAAEMQLLEMAKRDKGWCVWPVSLLRYPVANVASSDAVKEMLHEYNLKNFWVFSEHHFEDPQISKDVQNILKISTCFAYSNYLKTNRNSGFSRVISMLAGYLCPPPPRLFCSYHDFLFVCLSCSCQPYSRICLKSTWGGNNLFDKYGPNSGLSVGDVLFLSWVHMLVWILVWILVRVCHAMLVFVVGFWSEFGLNWSEGLNIYLHFIWVLVWILPERYFEGFGVVGWSECGLTLVKIWWIRSASVSTWSGFGLGWVWIWVCLWMRSDFLYFG